jgi:leucyl aminopeptidase
MSSLKLDVRVNPVGSPDFITFFIKGSPLPAGVPSSEFDGVAASTVLLRDKNQRTMVVGLGEKDKIEPDTLRRAAGAGIKQLLKLGATEVALDLTSFADHVAPAVEGAVLASYKFEGFGRDVTKKGRGVLARLQVLVKENELIRARLQARERGQYHPRHRQSPRQHAHARPPRRQGAGTRPGPRAHRQNLERAPP